MAYGWKASSWIWENDAPGINEYADFYADFAVEEARDVRLMISADAQYVVDVNGIFAAAGQYADYETDKVYDEIDITALARTGKNALHIRAYCPGRNTSVYRMGHARLRFEVIHGTQVLAGSDGSTRCAPGYGYESGDVELVTGQLGFSYHFDAREEEKQTHPAVVVSGPTQVKARPIARLEVLPRPVSVVRAQGIYREDSDAKTTGERMQRAFLSFREIREMTGTGEYPRFPDAEGASFSAAGGDGIFVMVDLLRETAGWFSMEIETDAPCEILIGWGEHTDDLRPRTAVGGRNFAARYFARAGRQRFTHYFQRMGARYIMLMVRAASIRIFDLGVIPTRYPVRRKGEIALHDRLHEAIHRVAMDTLETCMHEHYEDCPWREQALYAMDSRNQMLCGYYAFGEYDMPKASIRLLAESLRADGLLELCAPAKCAITIPSFSAMFLVELQEYHLFSGDTDFAREMLPVARAVADAFVARIADNGLIAAYSDSQHWNFYEWQEGLSGKILESRAGMPVRYDLPINCFVVLALTRLAEMLRWLGEDGSAYEAAAAKIRRAADGAFWNADEGLYETYRENGQCSHRAALTQALSVVSGVCPAEKTERVLEAMLRTDIFPVTLAYTVFKYDALMTRPEKYGRLVFDEVAEVWGRMLFAGATTFWETDKGAWDFDRGGSLCHGWSAVPVYLYYAYALGIYPQKPGFAAVRDQKCDSGLYDVTGAIVTREGKRITVGK